MAMGIGQQIRGMVDRARHYWSELTDEKGRDQRAHDEREDAVHQRYGGVRGQDEDAGAAFRDRQENSQDRGLSDAERADALARATHGGQGGQLGGQAGHPGQVQAGSQAQRQYTQQGGSGLQKTLGDQLGGGAGAEPDTVRSQQARRPGQQNH